MQNLRSNSSAYSAPTACAETAANETRAYPDVYFDGWRFRRDRSELWKDGSKIAVQEKPLRILEELLSRSGELVTRQHLIAKLWPNRIVEFDTALNTAVKKLRAALADDPDRPHYIETVPRKGYRFIGNLIEPNTPAPRHSLERPQHALGGIDAQAALRRRAPLTWSVATVLSIAVAATTWALWSGVSSDPRPSTLLRADVGESTLLRRRAEPNAITASSEAFDLYLRAKERISQLMPNQPELARGDHAPPRQQILEWLDGALRLDPAFAHAYVLRARAHLDFFIANLDVSEERLAAIRADLERARQLSRDESLGNDVRGLYAAFVDIDPERGLRELRYGEDLKDPAALLNQARILTSMGRFRESDDLLRRLLVDAPTDPLMLRMRVSNLVSENRTADLFRLVQWLREISPPEHDLRIWTYHFTGMGEPSNADALRHWIPAASRHAASEQLFAANYDLTLLRHESRYLDVKRVLDASEADTLRFGSFIGATPGLGHRPVAELRGWNALLLGDAQAAAAQGEELLAFVASQRETHSNRWVLHMLRAEGHLFVGNHSEAISAVRESMRATPLLLQVQAFRAYLAAMNLAWAGAHDEAVSELEQLTIAGPARISPVRVAREPLLTVPLRNNARFQLLAAKLEKEIHENQALQRKLAPN